jgi:hypothetical protein
MENLTTYVNSSMDEFYELGAELYEAMMDEDVLTINETIRKINKFTSDVKKSFKEDEL